MPRRAHLHLRQFGYRGRHAYFLTFCVADRRALFISAAAVALVREQVQRAATESQFAIVAYCFMPDHLHLLVEGADAESDCLRFIARAKQYSGFHFARAFNERLWQRYGYERVLRDDDDPRAVARYIALNPVRAGLVPRAEDYPFSGSDRYHIRDLGSG